MQADSAGLARLFEGAPLGRRVYDAVAERMLVHDDVSTRVTKSQVAFRRRRGFCWVWLPGRYLSQPGAEVVLSLALERVDPDPRWKQVVDVGRGRWMHHLEVRAVAELDAQVDGWLEEAYALAG
jgi:hypothetical protein